MSQSERWYNLRNGLANTWSIKNGKQTGGLHTQHAVSYSGHGVLLRLVFFVAFSPPESVDVVLSAAASHVAAKTRGEVARFLAWL